MYIIRPEVDGSADVTTELVSILNMAVSCNNAINGKCTFYAELGGVFSW